MPPERDQRARCALMNEDAYPQLGELYVGLAAPYGAQSPVASNHGHFSSNQ